MEHLTNPRMIMAADLRNLHERDTHYPRPDPPAKVPKMIADELETQTIELVRCDMSLGDILTPPGPDFVSNTEMMAAMDALSDKIGDPNADAQTKDLAVQSLEVSAWVMTRMLEILHENTIFNFTKKVYAEAMLTYELVDKHLKVMDVEGDPNDRLNTFRKTLYDLYPEFMPLELTEKQKDDWMYKLGEASTYAAALETVFKRHLACSRTVFKFILHRDIGSMLLESTQRAAGLYDPPPANKILATVRTQLLRWRQEEVISDDNVSNSAVVVRALQLREQMATMLRSRSSYESDMFLRMCREIFSCMKERVRAVLYDQRLAIAAHGNMIKLSRYNMATFILTQMNKYNDNTLPLIRSVLEKATFYAYTDKLISLEVLNNAAKTTPYSDIIEGQTKGEAISNDEANKMGGDQMTKEASGSDTLQGAGTSGDGDKDPGDDSESTQKKGPKKIVEEVIKLTNAEYEMLDPTGTYTQPRAFTRPPPKKGHRRSFLSVAREAAKQECEEDIKFQRQEEEKNEPPAKRSKDE